MTELLYATDAYCRTFGAIVTDVDKVAQAISLSRTAFFPGGGGQPCDTGTIQSGQLQVAVTRTQGGNLHVLDGPLPASGTAVTGDVDWVRRYRLMRTHTAMHVLSAVVFRDYGATVTGGNMEPAKGRMDFEFERLERSLVSEIEQRINEEVQAARAVHVSFLPRAEAFAIPDLIRTKVNLLPPDLEVIRVVTIEGLDLQADGGTHVGNTSEIGPLRISDYKSKGGINKRLYIQLEA
jgi:misacylated tRNA(Ala) deacylase